MVAYDPATGDRHVLRQGTNFIECQPKDPTDGFTGCYNKSLAARRDLDAALRGQGKPWLMLPGTPGAHIMIPINPGPVGGTK